MTTGTLLQEPETRPTVRIAVDLDGVLTEHPAPLARAANARFGLSLPERAFIDSAGLNVPLDVREWVYSDDGPAAELLPAPGAADFLAAVIRLLGEANALILTARPESAAGMTVAWLRAHGFPSCNVIFADEKMIFARRQGCGYAVEDSERHARNYAAGGVRCFLLDPGKQLDVADEPSITPVADYEAILAELRQIVGSTVAKTPLVVSSLPPVPGKSDSAALPRIVVSDAIHPVAREELSAHSDLVDVDGTDLDALLAAIEDADALVVRSETQVTEEVLAAGKKLKVVARAGVGVDNIDLAAATRAGVLVLNAPGANATSAGEHTIALLLAITRVIPHANESTHAGRWERKLIKPIDLRHRTVGIVGLGRVGSIVATRLKAFEMRVIAYDPYITAARFAELGVEQVALEDIWSQSDVVTFHVPATEETHHLLRAETLAKLKPGAIVINAARGEIVDQEALAESLRSGHVAAAGVDVYPHEPCRESPLFGMPNVVLTPHTGGSSAEALLAVGKVISSSTLAALRGEAVANAVNLPQSTLDAPVLQRLTTVAGAAGHLLSVLSSDIPDLFQMTVAGLVPADVIEHVTSAALSQAFEQWLGRRVTPVNARMVAEESGVRVAVVTEEPDEHVLPRFLFEARGTSNHTVTVTWDRVHSGIVEVDRFSLERPLAGHVLITHHHDQPGVIGTLGMILGSYNVNIAGMQVGRHAPRGEALMVTNVDDFIPEEALEEIRACDAVEDVFVVSLPPFEVEPDPVKVSAMSAAVAMVGK
ncbi:MAG TPA: phosphoglycerate dehydrogenase [Thermomicrobiales bacterium]|nr:phosphoglycerate dehydrogenase [Thermomicrobiales bacterium]